MNIAKSYLALILLLLMIAPILSHAADERVQVGDLIQINLPGEESLNRGFQVDKRGRITLPEIGPIYVAGYQSAQLENAVKQSLATVFRDVSNLSVFVKQQQMLISFKAMSHSRVNTLCRKAQALRWLSMRRGDYALALNSTKCS